MRLLLKGGIVVSGKSQKKSDVLIENEKIIAVEEQIEDSTAKKMDLSEKLLFPGFIDAHTHFDLNVSETVTADDFLSGTRAAITGGTTTIIDYATQYHGESLLEALDNWHRKADGKCYCDYGFHMSICDWNEQTSSELSELIKKGVTTYKLYMTYDSMKVSDEVIYYILKRLKEEKCIAGVHCENSDLIKALTNEVEDKTSVENHCHTHPVITEAEAVHRVLSIAKLCDTPVIIVHLSSKAGYEEVKAARKRGQKVYVETCPQYLLLDESCYKRSPKEARNFVIAPPLRTKKDKTCLNQAIFMERIQTIATDHCSFTSEQKELGEKDFTKIPGGMPGVETRGPLMYTYGLECGKQWNMLLCKLLSENAAKLYGLYPKKGCIREGSDADLVVYNPQGEHTITVKTQMSKSDFCPYEGFLTAGEIESVFLRGNLVYSHGGVSSVPTGRYLVRNLPDLKLD